MYTGKILGCDNVKSWIYTVGEKHTGEADQLTLASGGSELA